MSWIKNTLETVNENAIQYKKQQQFGLLLIAICVLFLGYSFYKEGFSIGTTQKNIGITVTVIGLITLVLPKLFYPFLFLWLLLGSFLGVISSFVVLSIIYYVFLTPIVFLGRLKDKPKSGWITKKENINYEKLY